jgi:hypothetical protein
MLRYWSCRKGTVDKSWSLEEDMRDIKYDILIAEIQQVAANVDRS